MKMFRSSIFSFDTLQLDGWKRTGLRNEILLGLLLVLGAEIVARTALAPIGDYWRSAYLSALSFLFTAKLNGRCGKCSRTNK